MHLDHVARGAGMRRDDRDVAARELVDQRRLADVGRTGNRNNKSIAQAFALALRSKDFFDLAQQRPDLRQRRRDQFGRDIALVGKIDAGFDQRGSLDDPRAPIARSVAEHALQLTQRLAALPVGVGMDQIVEAFGFGEIELAVFESAAGKFARLGRPHIFKSRQRREQRSEHRASAMNMKLGDVFAGRAGRSRKPQHHRVIDRPLAYIVQQRAGGRPRRRHFSGERGQRRRGLGPETRTMAIALGGRPDDRAKMVWSRGCIAYLSSGP